MHWTHWFTGLTLSLLLAMPTAWAGPRVLVRAQTLTLREEPASKGAARGKLSRYQPVELLERKGDEWARVKTADSATGWVMAQYLSGNDFVNSDSDKLDVRRGPGAKHDKIMEYNARNFPLRVLDATDDGWLMIQDYEGDKGWVKAEDVKSKPNFVIATAKECRIRKSAGTENELAFMAQKGYIFEMIEEKDGWLKVKAGDGDEGWISAKIVFGWLGQNGENPSETKVALASADKGEADKKESDSEKSASEKPDDKPEAKPSKRKSTAKSTEESGSAKGSRNSTSSASKSDSSGSSKSGVSSGKSGSSKSGSSKSSTAKRTSTRKKSTGSSTSSKSKSS